MLCCAEIYVLGYANEDEFSSYVLACLLGGRLDSSAMEILIAPETTKPRSCGALTGRWWLAPLLPRSRGGNLVLAGRITRPDATYSRWRAPARPQSLNLGLSGLPPIPVAVAIAPRGVADGVGLQETVTHYCRNGRAERGNPAHSSPHDARHAFQGSQPWGTGRWQGE